MPYHDLNVPYTADHDTLAHTLAFAAELGYTTVAVSLHVTGKLPAAPAPIPLSSIAIPPTVTPLTRLTITISDAAQNHRLGQFSSAYSLLALRPTSEKALQLCCISLECDIISLDFSARLPFVLKFKTLSAALQRGVRFEICYAPGIHSNPPDARQNLVSGSASLIRATRGRGIILSSEAKNALGLRGPQDVINLAHLWDLGQEKGKEAICEEAGRVVRLAAMKRSSFKGVVDVVDDGQSLEEAKSSAKQADATEKLHIAHKGVPIDKTQSQKDLVVSNSLKRKASATAHPTNSSPPLDKSRQTNEQPLSKREMKRRAKKARLEAQASANETIASSNA